MIIWEWFPCCRRKLHVESFGHLMPGYFVRYGEGQTSRLWNGNTSLQSIRSLFKLYSIHIDTVATEMCEARSTKHLSENTLHSPTLPHSNFLNVCRLLNSNTCLFRKNYLTLDVADRLVPSWWYIATGVVKLVQLPLIIDKHLLNYVFLIENNY